MFFFSFIFIFFLFLFYLFLYRFDGLVFTQGNFIGRQINICFSYFSLENTVFFLFFFFSFPTDRYIAVPLLHFFFGVSVISYSICGFLTCSSSLLRLFWCLDRAVLRDCGISWYLLLYFCYFKNNWF